MAVRRFRMRLEDLKRRLNGDRRRPRRNRPRVDKKTAPEILDGRPPASPRRLDRLGAEGCRLVAMLAEIGRPVRIFNLDTDYQFEETPTPAGA